jgi:hypothetical protein
MADAWTRSNVSDCPVRALRLDMITYSFFWRAATQRVHAPQRVCARKGEGLMLAFYIRLAIVHAECRVEVLSTYFEKQKN